MAGPSGEYVLYYKAPILEIDDEQIERARRVVECYAKDKDEQELFLKMLGI